MAAGTCSICHRYTSYLTVKAAKSYCESCLKIWGPVFD